MASLSFAWFCSICVFDILFELFLFSFTCLLYLRGFSYICVVVLSFYAKLGIVQLLNIWCSEVGKIEATVLELS